MNQYPSIIVTSNDKNIRFGAMPVRADIYGLKLERKIPFNQIASPSNSRPVFYLERLFSDIFWKLSQVRNSLSALVIGGGQNAFASSPTNLLEASVTVDSVEKCGSIIDGERASAEPISSNSNRVFKSTIYLKEAYLNSNKKSTILSDRVLIRDKFLLDEQTKKITKKIFYNGVLEENFNQSFAANEVAFIPTNNHMVAGGPLFRTSFGQKLKSTDITAYINSIKKLFADDLEKLKINPTIDPSIIIKREQQQNDYINNLQFNLTFRNSSYMEMDFSEYTVTVKKSKEPYYKGKDNKGILAENIKYQKNQNIYWPTFKITIGSASSLEGSASYVGSSLFNGAQIPIYSYPFGSPECFYPFVDNYFLVDGRLSTNFEERYAPTPVYSTKSVVAGYFPTKTVV
jgi:hypothetical protein